MGSLLFDYLLGSPLFEIRGTEDLFAGISEADLRRHLRDYREFTLKNLSSLHNEVKSDSSHLKILAPPSEVSIDLLTNLAFYVQQFLLRDPLFPFTVEPDEIDRVTDKFFNWSERCLNRESLVRAINYLRLLQPFVAADYVKILPVSYLRERPANVPIFFDRDNFANVLPQDTMKFIHDCAIVESMVKLEGGGWRTDGGLYPCRFIHVTFRDHGSSVGMAFQLTNQEILSVSEEDRTMEVLVTVPGSPPDPDMFRTWVDHSINRTALNLYDELMAHSMLAAEYRAAYVTDSLFSFELLQRSVRSESSIPVDTVNQLLRLNIPFLDGVRPVDLMKVRQEEGEAFETFRLALEREVRTIRLEKDPEVANQLVENALHELCEVQIQEVSRKIAQLKTRSFVGATLLAGSLVTAIQASGLGIPAIALAAVEGYRTYKEYQQSVRENPAFFLWKVKQQGSG